MCFQGVGMAVLVVFLLSVLGCSLAEGRLVSKCELMEAFHNLPEAIKEKGLTGDIVAKIVCHAEQASGFNTSAVKLLTPGMEGRSGQRDSGNGGSLSTVQPSTRSRQTAKQEEVWTLFGLFQLSNHVVCKDTRYQDQLLDICEMDCNDLIDDDIHNDIGCLLRIFDKLIKNGFQAGHKEELIRMIKLIFQEECMNKTASEYFAECANHH